MQRRVSVESLVFLSASAAGGRPHDSRRVRRAQDFETSSRLGCPVALLSSRSGAIRRWRPGCSRGAPRVLAIAGAALAQQMGPRLGLDPDSCWPRPGLPCSRSPDGCCGDRGNEAAIVTSAEP